MTTTISAASPLLLSQLNAENNLQHSLSRLEAEVRQAPDQSHQRWALTELLCVLGHWERALAQLQVGDKLYTKDAIWLRRAHMLRGLIRAEAQRSEVFAGQLLPMPVIDRPQWMDDLARALAANAAGEHALADTLRQAALELAPTHAGVGHWSAEQQSFDWISDSDTRLGPVCECILAGGYRWLAFADIEELQMEPPDSLLDLVWIPVTLRLRGTPPETPSLHGHLPARYSGTENTSGDIGSSQRDALLLSRLTRWQDVGETGVFALGQKTLMTQDSDVPLLSIRSLQLRAAAEARP